MSGRNYFKRGLSYLKRNGFYKTAIKAAERLHADAVESDYVPVHADEETLKNQKSHVFQNPYMFSILVPVYDTDPVIFKQMLKSVGDQTYGNWELILADASPDGSRRDIVREFMEEYQLLCRDRFGSIFDKVKYVRLEDNKGISGNTNEALALAKGDYVALLDHDDLLENTALFDIMSAIDKAEKSGRADESIKRVMAVYTDEDKISEDGTVYFDLHTKPDFDPVLLCTNNYICHFFAVDANLAKSVGGFRSEYDGAQDHDFILRCTEDIRRDGIIHVPKTLYHWRSTKGSTSENPDAKLYAYDAGKRAVSAYLTRKGISAKVTDSEHLGFFDIRYDRLHRSVASKSYEEYRSEDGPFSGSEEFVMILSGELSPVNGDYIADMMSVMNIPTVGAVTGKIIGMDNKIESAGYDVSDKGRRTPRFFGVPRRFSGYMHRANLHQLVEGFDASCVLVRKDAVVRWHPQIVLKDGYDIYYTPAAQFKRRFR